uniref:Uncharacterized protein n=1 Tax=Vespula pensylvanica TaxID=30213 RepID=A0A834UA40_VESPE|nr:hypothetical protein H0235_007773 [Vespula pensylvanica]
MSSDRLASLVPHLERGGRFTRGEERGGEGGGLREGGGRSEHERRSDQRVSDDTCNISNSSNSLNVYRRGPPIVFSAPASLLFRRFIVSSVFNGFRGTAGALNLSNGSHLTGGPLRT